MNILQRIPGTMGYRKVTNVVPSCRPAGLHYSVICISCNKNCCSNVLDLTATMHEDDLDNTDNTVEKLTNIVELEENQEDVDESLPSTSH